MSGVGGGQASGGILLDATGGQYLESISFKRILIFRFTAGVGLLLNASNGGAVTYSVCVDVMPCQLIYVVHIDLTHFNYITIAELL